MWLASACNQPIDFSVQNSEKSGTGNCSYKQDIFSTSEMAWKITHGYATVVFTWKYQNGMSRKLLYYEREGFQHFSSN